MLMTEWSTEVAIRVSREEGIEEGIQKGREEGEAKKQREIALNLLSMGFDSSIISTASGLPLAEIQALQAQLM
jgi:predicted transposase/invertase (TIGR01784 family)